MSLLGLPADIHLDMKAEHQFAPANALNSTALNSNAFNSHAKLCLLLHFAFNAGKQVSLWLSLLVIIQNACWLKSGSS